jgi:hypothetical protein
MNTNICEYCKKKVYQKEGIYLKNIWFHQSCFRCKECNLKLRIENYYIVNKQLFCSKHYSSSLAKTMSDTNIIEKNKDEVKKRKK